MIIIKALIQGLGHFTHFISWQLIFTMQISSKTKVALIVKIRITYNSKFSLPQGLPQALFKHSFSLYDFLIWFTRTGGTFPSWDFCLNFPGLPRITVLEGNTDFCRQLETQSKFWTHGKTSVNLWSLIQKPYNFMTLRKFNEVKKTFNKIKVTTQLIPSLGGRVGTKHRSLLWLFYYFQKIYWSPHLV